MAEQVAEALGAAGGARGQDGSATTRTRCSSPCARGARESMPGMLDTVLNLGLNDASVEGLAEATENERFAWDSYRRFVQMFGNVVRGDRRRGVRGGDQGGQGRRAASRTTPSSTPTRCRSSPAASRSSTGAHRRGVPAGAARAAAAGDPRGVRLLDGRARRRTTAASTASPTTGAPRSTSSRWCSATRATRRAPGVAFRRDEVTGAPEPSGDFLVNAQGEDVVSGVRNTRDIAELDGRDARGPRSS